MENRKLNALQGLRFVLFINVFLFHILGILNTRDIFHGYFENSGKLGVSGFIIISGFLASFSSQKSNYSFDNTVKVIKKHYKKFFRLHFLVLLVMTPLMVMKVIGETDGWIILLSAFIAQLTFTTSLFPNSQIILSFNDVAWFLSTYLLIMIFVRPLVFYLKRVTRRFLFLILTGMLVLEIILATICKESYYCSWVLYYFFGTRGIDYLIGAIVGVLYQRGSFHCKCKLSQRMSWLLLPLLALLQYMTTFIPIEYTYASAFAILMPIIIVTCADSETSIAKIMSCNKFVNLGNITMEMYLIHYALAKYIYIVYKRLFRHSLFSDLSFVLITLLLTILVGTIFHGFQNKTIIGRYKKE